MPKLFPLLVLLCLLFPRVSSAQAVAPLPAIVVRLDAGDVARQAYVCLDTATYRAVRLQVAAVPSLLQRVALLEYDRQLLESQLAGQRREGRAANADFDAAQAQARQLKAQPARPPLLLDSRVYASAGAGIVATLLYCFFH